MSNETQAEGGAGKEADAGHSHDKHEDHEIHIWVDGERFETRNREMTPNEIIRTFGGGLDPATHYLVRIGGHDPENFKDKGDIPIHLHDGDRFQIISIGPTPVSDGTETTGVAAFLRGLRELGYEPAAVPDKPDHIAFDYIVGAGTRKGLKVKHGLIVPADFPLSPPGGPHVAPHIHPINPNQAAGHPLGGVHQSQSQEFEKGIGGQWQYWSRPCPNWASSKKSVATYMGHIWRLWETQ
jgi:hypothetical protein